MSLCQWLLNVNANDFNFFLSFSGSSFLFIMVFNILHGLINAFCLEICLFNQDNTSSQQSSKALQELALRTCTDNPPEAYFSGKSPFPALDIFVESIASIGNVSGGSCLLFTYSFTNNVKFFIASKCLYG